MKRAALALAVILLLTATSSHTVGETTGAEAQWAAFWSDPPEELGWRFPYQHCFELAAEHHDLPIAFLLAVARGESNFDPNARSTANAHGLMQIRWPTTARHLGFTRLGQLYDPCRNVDAGARYLVELRNRYDGNTHRALAAYNYGPGRVPGTGPLPEPSAWYSAYVLDHLAIVTGAGSDFADSGRIRLVTFDAPYRARQFADSVVRRVPSVRLDWFRTPEGKYGVALFYADPKELARSRKALDSAGYRMARAR